MVGLIRMYIEPLEGIPEHISPEPYCPFIDAEEQDVDLSTFDSMAKLFVDKAAAFSYLVFVLLYTPCVATLGAMVREAGMKWMLFVAGWTTGLAYTSGVMTYQITHFNQSPATASAWIIGCIIFIAGTLFTLRRQGQKIQDKYIPITNL